MKKLLFMAVAAVTLMAAECNFDSIDLPLDPLPANNQCANATNLSLGSTVTGTLTNATPTTSIRYSDQPDKNDVFYNINL